MRQKEIIYCGVKTEEVHKIALALSDLDYFLRYETLQAMCRLIVAWHPHGVILDVSPGRPHALQACRALKGNPESRRMPVVLLFYTDDPVALLAGFAAGADECLPRPFDPRVVAANVQAVIRRYAPQAPAVAVLRVGPLAIDSRHVSATLDKKPLRLTAAEFAILEMLAAARGATLKRNDILDRVRRSIGETLSHSIETHICNLRRKLGPKGRSLIETVSGIGYRLAVGPTRSGGLP